MYKNILLPTDGLGNALRPCHGVLFAKTLREGDRGLRERRTFPWRRSRRSTTGRSLPLFPAELARGVKKRAEELHKELAEKALEVAEGCAETG
jgi:hypothetical protein